MSVFTAVSRSELVRFLGCYNVGELLDYQGIVAGAENSNFFVDTTTGQYVLTLFEKHTAEELGYFLTLMSHLSKQSIPVAQPVLAKNQHSLRELNNKPASLFTRLPGDTLTRPDIKQCAQAAGMLARIHLAALDCPIFRAPDRDYGWQQQVAPQVLPHLPAKQVHYLQQELEQQQQNQPAIDLLPQGLIHGDLFRDNALFSDSHLTGVLDWYYACNSSWLYDLAIFVNDWCCHDNGSLNKALLQACVQAYQAERSLSTHERHYFLPLLRAAACRFWLSRLLDVLTPRSGALVLQKDPQEFFDKLCHRCDEVDLVQSCWSVGT